MSFTEMAKNFISVLSPRLVVISMQSGAVSEKLLILTLQACSKAKATNDATLTVGEKHAICRHACELGPNLEALNSHPVAP